VDVSGIDDNFFAREVVKKTAEESEESKFFAASGESTDNQPVVSAARKEAQVKVDSALQANIDAVELLKSYLQSRFTLRKGDKPHLMKF